MDEKTHKMKVKAHKVSFRRLLPLDPVRARFRARVRPRVRTRARAMARVRVSL